MKRLVGEVLLSLLLCLVFVGTPWALITREQGAKSIAGVLAEDGEDVYTFRAQPGQILFLDLDGALYQTRGAHEAEYDTAVVTPLAAEEGGCEDEGGAGQFCLQVLQDEMLLCWAGRPAPPPGWSRDPRLACVFAERGQDYQLRIFWTEEEDGCETGTVTVPGQPRPYLLNFSLRDEAPEGRIQPAVGQSKSGF